MSRDKISTQEIIELLSDKASISKKAADDFIKQLFTTIEETLLAGEQVKLKGLGTFKLQWNEPRKSVNVQTGEEIILAGYNKVSFTPEAGLKELVNEPYAHLEPVELNDEDDKPSTNDASEALSDPLRMLTEQANEIKDILTEIQSLSAEQNTELPIADISIEKEETKQPLADTTDDLSDQENEDDDMAAEAVNINIQASFIEEDDFDDNPSQDTIPENSAAEMSTTEMILEDKLPEDNSNTESSSEIIIEAQNSNPEIESKNTSDTTKEPENNVKPSHLLSEAVIPPKKPKKRKPFFKRIWVWIIIILLAIISSTLIVYYSSSCVSCWFEYKVLNQSQRAKFQNTKSTIEGYWIDFQSIFIKENNSAKPDSIVVSEQTTDTVPQVIKPAQPVSPIDSLDILLNKPRVYTEFIGSERIMEGSRLARIAERYYGTRDFWVYIYEANKERIKNPDLIPIGTLIKIPKVDARLLDTNNPKVMIRARELHDLYVQKNK